MSDLSRRPVRVGITEKNQAQYWDMVNAGWHDAAARLGLELRIEAPVSEDIDEQIAMIHRQLDDGVDAIAFVGTRADAFGSVVDRARSMGVPAFAFDLDAPESGRLTFVGMPSPHQAGKDLGDRLHTLIPAGAPVIAQTGSAKAPGATGKLAGFVEAMREHDHPVVLGENDGEDVSLSLEIARRLLLENPEVAGMFGGYSYHPVVQARAVQDAGRVGEVQIVGFDMLPETVDLIERGLVAGSIWIQEYYFGYLTAVALHDVVRLGRTDVLALYGMDPGALAGNVVNPPLRFFDAATTAEFRQFSERVNLLARTAVTPT